MVIHLYVDSHQSSQNLRMKSKQRQPSTAQTDDRPTSAIAPPDPHSSPLRHLAPRVEMRALRGSEVVRDRLPHVECGATNST